MLKKKKRIFYKKEELSSCLAGFYSYNVYKLTTIETHFVNYLQKFTDLEDFVYIILVLCPRNQRIFLSWRVKERRQRVREQKERKKNFQM